MRILQIICLTLFLSACFKAKKTDNSEKQISLATSNKQSNEEASENQQYFSNIEDFKRFILEKKWVDVGNENPCNPHGQHITVKDGVIDEYNTIEPSKYIVDTIILINSNTLGVKIKSKSNRDVVFKVKVIDLEKKIVKWIYNYNEYDAKPYDIVCGSSDSYKESAVVSSSFTEKWEGFYQFTSVEEGEKNIELGQGKNYDLYVSLDSVNLKSYGYRHLRDRKSYAIEKEGILYIYSQDADEDLLLKLIVKNNEYIATSLIDRKGEFKVLKK